MKEGVAPFAGAWIEIKSIKYRGGVVQSLPSRERGLKSERKSEDEDTGIGRSLRGSVD